MAMEEISQKEKDVKQMIQVLSTLLEQTETMKSQQEERATELDSYKTTVQKSQNDLQLLQVSQSSSLDLNSN